MKVGKDKHGESGDGQVPFCHCLLIRAWAIIGTEVVDVSQDTYDEIRLGVANCAREMAASGLITGTAGNVSARTADGCMAITPTGVPYAHMTAEDICVLQEDGVQVAGHLQPSSEVPLHVAAYRARADVGAVVHTHSLYATAFAVANRPLAALHYVIATMGDDIPVVPYYLYGSDELAQAVGRAAAASRGLLLQNHGVLAMGDNLAQALYHAQTVEYLAQLQWLAEAVGSPRVLNPGELAAVRERFRGYGQK